MFSKLVKTPPVLFPPARHSDIDGALPLLPITNPGSLQMPRSAAICHDEKELLLVQRVQESLKNRAAVLSSWREVRLNFIRRFERNRPFIFCLDQGRGELEDLDRSGTFPVNGWRRRRSDASALVLMRTIFGRRHERCPCCMAR